MSWARRAPAPAIGCIDLTMGEHESEPQIVLAYGGYTAYPVTLDTTDDRVVGTRWWFRCPCCGRRRGKLYRPPGEQVFYCRLCHRLVYTSTQTHDPRLNALRRDPQALMAQLDAFIYGNAPLDSRTVLALRAVGL